VAKINTKKVLKYFGIFFAALILISIGRASNTPSSKSTLQPEVKSEHIESSPEPITENESPLVKVINVVDGDTFKIETGGTVRMIGIDTPETVAPGKPIQCYGKEASQKTEDLIEGKEVRLEKDVSETDKYGRLLRYVYVGDIFVNEYLVAEGYAKVSTYPPDVKYKDIFLQTQKKAQEENKGLWNESNCFNLTPEPTIKPATTTNTTTGGSYVCDCSKTCSQMSSCAEAQYQLDNCGCFKRDADGDGIACDSDCQ